MPCSFCKLRFAAKAAGFQICKQENGPFPLALNTPGFSTTLAQLTISSAAIWQCQHDSAISLVSYDSKSGPTRCAPRYYFPSTDPKLPKRPTSLLLPKGCADGLTRSRDHKLTLNDERISEGNPHSDQFLLDLDQHLI